MVLTWNRIVDWDATTWRDRAACRHTDPNLFFPLGNTGLAVAEVEQAKAVCRSCPVRGQCLEFALDTNQEAGIWGGKNEEERRKLRRMRRAGRRPPITTLIG